MFLHDVILESMVQDLVLPKIQFDITPQHIAEFMVRYVSRTNTKGSVKKSEQIYNAKLAALSLLKYKKDKGMQLKEGFVYFIENPAWPGMYKIGMTYSPKERLKQYQTYSPRRDYSLKHWSFWFTKSEAEKSVRELGVSITHEWVTLDSKSLAKHLEKVNITNDLHAVLPLVY